MRCQGTQVVLYYPIQCHNHYSKPQKSSSNMAHVEKDCRVASIKKQWLEYLGFHYCVVAKGWFCKNCVSFSGVISPGVPYITKTGIFGDHCSRRSTGELESECYKEAIENKKSYHTLARKCTNVWKMLLEASLTLDINKPNTN